MPCYDPKGNYLVNPSFESGPRYWHDVPSGADTYAQIVEGDAHTGRYALRGGTLSFCYPTEVGHDYVFSFYAKAGPGEKKGGGVGCNTYTWTGVYKTKWWGVGTEWKRVEYLVTNWQYRSIAFSLQQCGKTLFDDFQFEEGRRATEYRGNPIGIELKTDSPDDFFAPADMKFNARLVVRGPAACRGTVDYSVVDFFGRETGRGSLPFDLANGEQTLPAFDETLFALKGVYAIRLSVSGTGFLPYSDCVRLARYAYAEKGAPNRRLHEISGITWGTRAQTNAFARIRRLYDTLGLWPRCGAVSGFGGDYPPEVGHAIIARNVEWGFPTTQHLFDSKRMDATGWKKAPSADAKLIADVTAVVEDTVRAYPEITVWDGPSEVSGWVRMCQERNWKEYVKLMRAAHEAVHRANPKAAYACYGTCNLVEQGRTEILEFLAAAKEMWPDFRFDTVDVHPYRPHPEFPDYDADWQALFDGLDALGYGDMIVAADEGCYFTPIRCQPWGGISPWAGTLTKDSYGSQHMPSFDLGWGERVSAAMTLRYNLISYRHGARVRNATSWGTRAIDSRNPVARYVATAAQLELLGRATFLEDVRFAPDSRAYVFDDHDGHAVAAFWRFSLALDYGTEPSGVLDLPVDGLDCEIFDMMGNRCKVEKVGGGGSGQRKIGLPLGNFPMYIRVPRDQAAKLAAAFRAGGANFRAPGRVRLRMPKNAMAVRADGAIDWKKVPSVRLKGGQAQFAWTEKALTLRWTADDDKLPLFALDTLADERANAEVGHEGLDENDMVYLVRAKAGAPGAFEVFRREAPDYQLTGGVDRGLVPNAVEPLIAVTAEKAKKGRVFTLVFPPRPLEPALLRAGRRIGLAQGALGFDDTYVTVEFSR